MDNHIQRVILLIVVAWLGWLVPPVSAAPGAQQLFEVETTVPDQLAASREAAIRPALEEVLEALVQTTESG